MPVQWQTAELPLGSGMDDNSSKAALPPGRPLLITNGHFGKQGAYTKRSGFDVKLGSDLAVGARLAQYGNHLLAVADGKIYDYSKPNTGVAVIGAQGAFMDRGTYRAVPTTARVAKSSSSDIAACDAFSVHGFTLLAWLDGSSIKTEIIDESTGAVVDSNGFESGDFGGIIPAASFHVSGYLSGDSSTINFYLTFAGYVVRCSGNGNNLWAWGSVVHAISGTWLASRISVDGGSDIVRLGAISSDGTTVGAAKLTNTLVVSSSGTHASANVDTSAPVSCAYHSGTNLFYVAYRTFGGSLAVDIFNPSTSAYSSTQTTAAARMRHLSLVSNGSVLTAIYDVAATVGTHESTVLRYDVSGGGSSNGVILRSVSLASDAIYSGTTCYFEVVYHSQVSASVPQAIAGGSKLSNGAALSDSEITALQLPTINGAAFVVTIGGDVCARVFRGAALTMDNTASASETLTGLLFATRAISQAETFSIEQAISLGGAALVRFDLGDEKSRAVSAFRDLIGVGGSPTCFDGTTPAEHGFHVYPEVRLAVAPAADGSISSVSSGLPGQRSTAFDLGALANMQDLDSGVAAAVYDSNIWLCVVAGTTGSSAPAGFFTSVVGAVVTDGTSVWQNLGPRPPITYASGISVSAGSTFVPTSPNGFYYVITEVIGASSDTTPGTEPTWPTTIGDGVTVSAGNVAHSLTFTCAGSTRSQLTRAKSYGLGAVYSWVDDQGQLHRSALSPLASLDLEDSTSGLTSNPIWAISTLRLTAKSGVRIDVYRTAGDGTTLQQIATMVNNADVDLVGFIDDNADSDQEAGSVCYQGALGAGEFPNEAPPSCSTLCVWGNRVVANSRENPYCVFPSKLCVDGFGVAWSGALAVQLNAEKGEFMACVAMDANLIVLQERGIAVVAGEGPDNTGSGTAFAQPQQLATDVGCSNPDSVILTPAGVVFQSDKGIYLLGRDLTTTFVGEAVLGHLTGSIVSAASDPTTHQVLFVTDTAIAANVFLWDHKSNSWGTWSIAGDGFPASVAVYNGKPVVSDTVGGVYQQSGSTALDPDGNKCAWSAEFAPVHFAGVQGYQSVRACNLAIKSSGSPSITVGIKEDLSESTSYSFSAVQLTQTHDSLQCLLRSIRLASVGLVITETTPGDTLELEGIAFQVGVRGGLTRKGGNRRVG